MPSRFNDPELIDLPVIERFDREDFCGCFDSLVMNSGPKVGYKHTYSAWVPETENENFLGIMYVSICQQANYKVNLSPNDYW